MKEILTQFSGTHVLILPQKYKIFKTYSLLFISSSSSSLDKHGGLEMHSQLSYSLGLVFGVAIVVGVLCDCK